jgi:hypothetical protein
MRRKRTLLDMSNQERSDEFLEYPKDQYDLRGGDVLCAERIGEEEGYCSEGLTNIY